VTTLAASIWTFSNLFIKNNVLLSHTTIINQVTKHKHLGLDISNDGSWQKHIDLITKKAFIRVNILRKFNKLVSSANSFIDEWISVTMSFINIIKNRGPRIDPWGTPALIVRHLECALSITARCFQSGFTPGDCN
jgi:hypothetical protein